MIRQTWIHFISLLSVKFVQFTRYLCLFLGQTSIPFSVFPPVQPPEGGFACKLWTMAQIYQSLPAFQNYHLFSLKYHRLKKVVDKSKLLHIDETHKEEKYKPRALCYYFSSSGFEIVYLYKSSKLYTRSISFVLIDSPHDNWCFVLIDSPPSSAPTWPAFRTTQATRTSRSSQTIGLYMSAPSQLRDGGQTNPTACQSFPSAYS